MRLIKSAHIFTRLASLRPSFVLFFIFRSLFLFSIYLAIIIFKLKDSVASRRFIYFIFPLTFFISFVDKSPRRSRRELYALHFFVRRASRKKLLKQVLNCFDYYSSSSFFDSASARLCALNTPLKTCLSNLKNCFLFFLFRPGSSNACCFTEYSFFSSGGLRFYSFFFYPHNTILFRAFPLWLFFTRSFFADLSYLFLYLRQFLVGIFIGLSPCYLFYLFSSSLHYFLAPSSPFRSIEIIDGRGKSRVLGVPSLISSFLGHFLFSIFKLTTFKYIFARQSRAAGLNGIISARFVRSMESIFSHAFSSTHYIVLLDLRKAYDFFSTSTTIINSNIDCNYLNFYWYYLNYYNISALKQGAVLSPLFQSAELLFILDSFFISDSSHLSYIDDVILSTPFSTFSLDKLNSFTSRYRGSSFRIEESKFCYLFDQSYFVSPLLFLGIYFHRVNFLVFLIPRKNGWFCPYVFCLFCVSSFSLSS